MCLPCNDSDTLDKWDNNNCSECLDSDHLLGLEQHTLLSKKMDLQISKSRNDKIRHRKKTNQEKTIQIYTLHN